MLTHHPHDVRQAEGITVLSCPVEEAVQIALDTADGKNVEVFSANIGRQLLERGLIDEIDLHIVPILLGDGIRLYHNPGHEPIQLHHVGNGEYTPVVNLRYWPSRPIDRRRPGPAPAHRRHLDGDSAHNITRIRQEGAANCAPESAIMPDRRVRAR